MKKRVLIVDDDTAVRDSIKRALEGAGYESVAAADGREAAARFVPEQIDLVLLDLNLPFQGGWEVFEGLTARYPLVPVIIITGMPGQYQTARAAGVGALMEKPIEVPVLLATMEELLREPKENHLRRMCGFLDKTVYVSPGRASQVWKTRGRSQKPCRHQPQADAL